MVASVLSSPKFALRRLRDMANFGFGTLARVATGPRPRALHGGQHLVGPREGEIFGRVGRRQDLDHRLVLDPHLDNVKRPAIAVEGLPAGSLRDLLDLFAIGRNAQRKMRRPVAAVFRVLDKAAAGRAVRLKFSAGGINLDARAVVIELQRKEASRIGWK